jgi:hypothetical protein
METGEPPHPAEFIDRKRLILSLAGGALIAAVGFALILFLVACLTRPWMIWLVRHPDGTIIDVMAFMMVTMIMFLLPALTREARKGRGVQKKDSNNDRRTVPPL